MTTAAAPSTGEGFLLPLGDEESDGFWEGTAAGELRMQECGSCGALRFPPRVMCPECQSTERSWRAVSGRGTIWSFVVVHPPVLPAYAPYVPFPVVTVTLAEKPSLRMVGNLVTGPGGDINGVDACRPRARAAPAGPAGREVWQPGPPSPRPRDRG
jgi:uncharacterized OB-fold protein